MKQVLHIFHKDVRHLWKEIAISWCLLAAYVWEAKEKWDPENAKGFGYASGLTDQLVSLLLIISWCTLLIRVIQDESLVGDRQFWVTRPYRWFELLSAKILFAIALIHVPLLTAQLALFKLAGFTALPHFGGLIYMHAALLAILFVPVAVLATVTSSFVRVILTGFVVVLYIFGKSALLRYVPGSFMSQANEIPATIQGVIFAVACLAIVLIQYARRWTLVSRGIIVVAAALTVLVEVVSPYGALIAKAYPRMGDEVPLRVALNLTKPEKEKQPIPSQRAHKPEKNVSVGIPLWASPSNNNEVVQIEGARVEIELPDGRHWQSRWQPQGGIAGVPDSPAYVNFAMPTNLFEAAKSSPVKITVEWALAVFQRGERWQLIANGGLFSAPRLGLCFIMVPDRAFLVCRAALYGPGSLLATISSSESSCPTSPEHMPPHEITSYYWNLFSNARPSAVMNPVVDEMISFNPASLKDEEQREGWRFVPRICPGTPIHFTALKFLRRTSIIASIDGIKLGDYRSENFGYGFRLVGGASYGIVAR